METDRIKWNAKHALKTIIHDADSFLVEHHHLLPLGKVLDIACGRGRNSYFLYEKGYQMFATDISDVAMQTVDDYSHRHQMFIEKMIGDLDKPDFLRPFAPFDALICVNFKPENQLLQLIPDLLRIGGVFLWSSYNEIQAGINGFPFEKALQKDEFVSYFSSMETLTYRRFEDSTGYRDGYIFIKI